MRTTTIESRSASTSHNNNNQLKSVNHYQHRQQQQPQLQQQQQQDGIQDNNCMINNDNNNANNNNNNEAVVTPELLVDALSGHEDGLLAIAERLMEHYEAGYDVMGEAIIDAFADVQKLFQHVVEAAHMEGAAFEASRREAEQGGNNNAAGHDMDYEASPLNNGSGPTSPSGGGGAPMRHDEFIDDDVRAILADASRLGQSKKEAGQYVECYELFEEACNSSSSLLPVDSDHRGRLQLSIARAESMSPERACAILKYAMDDVLRSGKNIRPNNPLEKSKRSDCVLQKPPPSASSPLDTSSVQITQSNEEVLASLVQEMKEVSSAPMYEDSPIQEVADRFWVALADVQKQSSKNEEWLEQSLGKLKADFLLARAEWEEKLSESTKSSDEYRKRCYALQDIIEQNNNNAMANNHSIHSSPPTLLSRSMDYTTTEQQHNNNPNTYTTNAIPQRQTPSVVSIGSGIAQHAKSLVGSFGCGMGGSSANNDKDRDRASPTHPRMHQDNNQHVPGVSFTNSNDSNSRNNSAQHTKQFMYHHQASI